MKGKKYECEMIKLTIYEPKIDDLSFRRDLLKDEETMAYNHKWGGTIDFSFDRWKSWYETWLKDQTGKHFYRYLVNEEKQFVGEIAYHFDEDEQIYLANIIILAKYRRRGYGRLGLQLLLTEAKKRNVKTIYDNLALDNDAYHLFIEQGFTEISRDQDLIWLKKDLF